MLPPLSLLLVRPPVPVLPPLLLVSWSSLFEPSCRSPQLDNRQVFSALKTRHFQGKLLA